MITKIEKVTPNHPPMQIGTPVLIQLSWVKETAYITRIYGPESFSMGYVWHYYDVVGFKTGHKSTLMFGKHIINLLTGLREDGSAFQVSG